MCGLLDIKIVEVGAALMLLGQLLCSIIADVEKLPDCYQISLDMNDRICLAVWPQVMGYAAVQTRWTTIDDTARRIFIEHSTQHFNVLLEKLLLVLMNGLILRTREPGHTFEILTRVYESSA